MADVTTEPETEETEDTEEAPEVTSDTLPHPFGTCVPLGECVCEAATDEDDEDDEDDEEAYDPGAHTIAEVQQYVTDYPDELEAVTAAEKSGKNRTTLVNWLESE